MAFTVTLQATAFWLYFWFFLKQSTGLHVWCPQWHQDEQPRGAGQHLQQLFLRWVHLYDLRYYPCICNSIYQYNNVFIKLQYLMYFHCLLHRHKNFTVHMSSYCICVRLLHMKPGHSQVWSLCRLSCGGLDGVHAVGSDPGGGHDAGLRPPGRGFPADRRLEERRGSPHRQPQWAVHGRLHRSVQLCEYEEALVYWHSATYRWTEMIESWSCN